MIINPKHHHLMTTKVARRAVREAGREHLAETDHAAADVTERA